jgi:hypothetical protein
MNVVNSNFFKLWTNLRPGAGKKKIGAWAEPFAILAENAQEGLMSWTPHEREIQVVSALDGPKRYEYWIKKVADHEEVWSLWDEGWALLADDSGQEAVPVWPHEEFAQRWAVNDWARYQPKAIPLEEWLTRWISGMERDGRQVAVFPTESGSGVIVNPQRLKSDLDEELSQY